MLAVDRAVTDEGAALEGWSAALAEVHARVAHRFRRVAVRERARRSLAGRLARVERKHGWQLAEAMGEADPHGVQRLRNEATRDAEGVRDDRRGYVVAHLGDAASGVLLVDETGFLKQGTRSCGVARQYCGAAGATAKAPIGGFLADASDRGTAFIDRALYLPRAWARDRERRAAAGIPKGTRCATKITLAKRLLTRAFAAGVPARWVVADSFYGRSHALRRWLEQRRRPHVLMIPKTTAVVYRGRRERAEQLGTRLPDEAWSSMPDAAGGGELRAWQWACLSLVGAGTGGMGRWLLVRRDIADPDELSSHLAYGPAGTTPAELVRVCGVRWQIEEGCAQAKGELGLDQDEVRRWDAWHRFVTLCLLAHAYLAVLRRHAGVPDATMEGTADEPDLLPLTVPEVRRLVLALAGEAERRAFRLGWSRWRRRRQAAAARSRAVQRGRDQRPSPATPVIPPPAVPGAALTDAEWALVQPLLPPQRPPAGRPRHDHRAVLSGIVWVLRRRGSWRAVPKECGKWEMVYQRYRLWRAEGRWPRIAAALGLEEREVAL